jgi:PEP-CTERM motif
MRRRSLYAPLSAGVQCLVTIALLVLWTEPSRAATSLAYSFETVVPPNGPDGFFGLGATVSQEPTIGVTHLASSLEYVIGVGGFVGARTESVIPATLNDPPGVDYVLLDLTIPQVYPDTFADLGITVFGHALNAPGGAQFGHQVQFSDTIALAGLAAGTHQDLRIDLNLSVGPYRPGESFNNIFGPGPTDLTVASAFQFFVSKNVVTPVTFYIDNVRLVPEPATASLGLLGSALLAFRSRRR